jgi:hypothetical protein
MYMWGTMRADDRHFTCYDIAAPLWKRHPDAEELERNATPKAGILTGEPEGDLH